MSIMAEEGIRRLQARRCRLRYVADEGEHSAFMDIAVVLRVL
jgi:hypothetical protein